MPGPVTSAGESGLTPGSCWRNCFWAPRSWHAGEAVSRATVRALAERTGLSKDTVARSLQRLRKADAFTVEPERHDDNGRFVSVCYLVDLTTLPIELVIVEPARQEQPRRPPRVASPEQLSMLG